MTFDEHMNLLRKNKKEVTAINEAISNFPLNFSDHQHLEVLHSKFECKNLRLISRFLITIRILDILPIIQDGIGEMEAI